METKIFMEKQRKEIHDLKTTRSLLYKMLNANYLNKKIKTKNITIAEINLLRTLHKTMKKRYFPNLSLILKAHIESYIINRGISLIEDKGKQYRVKNKEKIAARGKKYRLKNEEKIRIYAKLYAEKQRQKQATKREIK